MQWRSISFRVLHNTYIYMNVLLIQREVLQKYLNLTLRICSFLIHKTLGKIALPLLTRINLNYTFQWSCLYYVILPFNEIHSEVKSVTSGRRECGIEITKPKIRYRMFSTRACLLIRVSDTCGRVWWRVSRAAITCGLYLNSVPR